MPSAIFYRLAVLVAFLFALNPSLHSSDAPGCAKCHQDEAKRYSSTAMGRSLVPQSFQGGTVTHDRSRSVVTIESKDTTIVHRLVENGITAEYPLQYQIGGGMMGATFVVRVHDYLFESPVSWFNGYGWDVSPGYGSSKVLDFDRNVPKTCLFCHSSGARFSDPDGRHLVSKSLDPITCERCHGPGEAHALHPSAKNILNPAKLTGPARDSICEQCHLEGTGRVLNPGKDWTDFHPGELAEQTFATYVTLGSDNHDVIPASEVEQLAESHCARASQGKLWCGSCHHPHGVSGPRQEEIKAVCTSCHQKLSPTTHPAGLAECTSCHLPTSATTYVAHAAHTDHRILRNPAKASTAQEGKEKLIAWREPPLPLRQRDLGMGELMLAPSEKYEEMRRHGSDLLLSLAAPGLDHDADAVSSLEAFYFQKGDLEKAVQFGRRSVEVAPQSGMMALNFAIVLDKSGEAEEAERQFLRAIDLDPSLKDAYGRLAMMYVKQSRSQDANNIIDRYLQWNPDEILFHSIKQSPLLNH